MWNGTSRYLAAILICLLVVIVASGCGGDDSQSSQSEADAKAQAENFSGEPVPFQVLTGSTSGNRVRQPTAVIARNEADLTALKKKQFSNGVKRDSVAPVEFPKQQIVAVFLPKAPAGTTVTITDVYPKGGQVHVKAVELLPGKNCISDSKSVYPFHWVGTRMMQGSPDLELAKQRSPDC